MFNLSALVIRRQSASETKHKSEAVFALEREKEGLSFHFIGDQELNIHLSYTRRCLSLPAQL